MPDARPLWARLRGRLKTFVHEFRFFGLWIAVRNLILCAVREIATYSVAIVYAAPTRGLAAYGHSPKPDLTFDFEPPGNVSRDVLQAAWIDLDKNPHGRYRGSCPLIVGRYRDAVCFVCIVSSSSFEIPNRQKVFLPQAGVYVACCYTIPRFRGQGLFGEALQAVGSRVERQGFDTVYLYCNFENEASQRAVHKLGFEPVAKSWVIGIGPLVRRGWKDLVTRPGLTSEP